MIYYTHIWRLIKASGGLAFLAMEGMVAMWRVSRDLPQLDWCWIEESVIPAYLGLVCGHELMFSA